MRSSRLEEDVHLWRPPRHPALATFVRSVEYVEDDPGTTHERMVPAGDVSLVVALHLDRFSVTDEHGAAWVDGACVAGPRRRAEVVSTAPQRGMVGVSFLPGGAVPFLGVPVHAVAGAYPSLGEVWGREGEVVRERLLEVSPGRMLDVVEQVLLARLVDRPERDPAVDLAIRALDRGASVGAVVDRFGTTAKPFVRRFRAATGLPPKTFARLRRLQRLLAGLPVDGPVDWAAAAAEHGYDDQSHLVHDFAAITGVTPTQYRPRSSEARNHLPC